MSEERHESRFEWPVRLAGYTWTEAPVAHPSEASEPKDPFRYLVPDWRHRHFTEGYRSYRPFDLPGLFYTLALTPPTEEGIAAFAKRYGQLGLEPGGDVYVPNTKQEGDQVRLPAEHQLDWAHVITRMRDLIALWNAIRRLEYAWLEDNVVWNGDIFEYRGLDVPELKGTPIGLRNYRTRLRKDLQTQPVLTDQHRLSVARDVLIVHLQRSLPRQFEPRIYPKPESLLGVGIEFCPPSLEGALWLQFAQAVEHDHTFRACDECGLWFLLTPEVTRADRRYCSNSCRTNAYRKRKRKAHSLHSEGLSIGEIADRLDADADVVAKWVRSPSGKEDGP